MAMRAAADQPELASQRAQAQKSSKVFCLAARLPASCQARPYSPPPRRQATASIPPRSSQTAQVGENDGVVLTATPPYAAQQHRDVAAAGQAAPAGEEHGQRACRRAR